MKEFKEYYTRDAIIKYLCKIRIKYANKRHKVYLLNKLTTPEYYTTELKTEYDDKILKELDNLLPKRKQWLTNGHRTHKMVINRETKEQELKKIDTDEKNKEILYNTIKKHSRKGKKFKYIENLNQFILDIQNSIQTKTFSIEKPDILPEIKEINKFQQNLQLKKNNALECRPISRFYLKDRIVISLTNKFLTELFDDLFEGSSLAFRAIKDTDIHIKNHHLAINRIKEYRTTHLDKILFVAECDMKKFYDTVNHKVCLNAFYKLIDKSKLIYPTSDFTEAIYLFNEYLNCYSFQGNVEILNNDTLYWGKQRNSNQKKFSGKYPWVNEDFFKNEYYKLNPNDRIGIPQGGALSGLIANIMLDYADKKLKDIPDLFYVRYCDDMILMHHDKNICNEGIEIYKSSINELLLFNHPFKNEFFTEHKNRKSIKTNLVRTFSIKTMTFERSFKYSLKSFWTLKSKGPYMWGNIDVENNVLPWIGFVGYEINYKGEARIRKRSLKKEIDKQQRVVTSIIKRITNGRKNARNNTVYRSALEKLIGMSVGRIKMYNYKTCLNKICWADGFQSIDLNNYSKVQLKILDRNRYKFLNILTKFLGAETVDSKKPTDNKDILKMKKPFSYYYQVGEKKMRNKEEILPAEGQNVELWSLE